MLAFADSNPKCRASNSRRVLYRAWVRSYHHYLVEFHTKYTSLFIQREVCLQLRGNQCRWLANHLILLISVYKIKEKKRRNLYLAVFKVLKLAESSYMMTQVSHFDSEVPGFVMQLFYLFFKEKENNKHNKIIYQYVI